MNDGEIELDRRRVLGALGSIGAAGALGSAGTLAYFSDQEAFANNEIVAGELDLMVDWQEHYFDWSDDEERAAPSLRAVDGSGDVAADEYGLPTDDEPLVAVHADHLAAIMDATATEAWPDVDGDGIQDLIRTRDQIRLQNPTYSDAEVEAAFRAQFANVPDDLEAPVVHLQDVKPGDFGEVTFSVHLFDNPGFLWATGRLRENAENGHTDPEADDADEDGATDETGELPDALRAALWYDDGDNVMEGEETLHSPHDVDLPSTISVTGERVVVVSGTLREVLDALAGRVPLDADPTTAERDCFPHSTTRYLGFAWWLPPDHANELQTDSVRFDLGFYTEQCRHNDGEGLEPVQ